jgi:hypothetical protein
VRKYEVLETEYKQYESDSPLSLNCPCDITGLSKKIDGLRQAIRSNETPNQKKQRLVNIFITNSQIIKDREAKAKSEGCKQPTITFDKEVFLNAVRENANKSLSDKRWRYLPWQDEKTGLWGIVLGS